MQLMYRIEGREDTGGTGPAVPAVVTLSQNIKIAFPLFSRFSLYPTNLHVRQWLVMFNEPNTPDNRVWTYQFTPHNIPVNRVVILAIYPAIFSNSKKHIVNIRRIF